MAIKVEPFFNRNHNIVMDMMTLLNSSQVLCNMWSYDFYDMTLSTE